MPTYRRSVVPASPGSAALPLVAIVGRPNVGKSTLFNRLTHSRRSIVGDEPGITRDRIYGEYDWEGRRFRLVDTGGIVPDDPELIPTEIYNQARVALEEAAALIMVVDVRTELASPDYNLVRLLQRGNKPVFLAVNKVEGDAMPLVAENFRQLGLREVYPISSEHGLGIGDLLDAVSEAIPAQPGDVAPETDDERAEEDEISEGGPLEPGEHQDPELRRMRSCTARMENLSSMKHRLPSSGGPTLANPPCSMPSPALPARSFRRSPAQLAMPWTRLSSLKAANTASLTPPASVAKARPT